MNIMVYCAMDHCLSLKEDLTEREVGGYDHCNYEKPWTWFNINANGVPFLCFFHDSGSVIRNRDSHRTVCMIWLTRCNDQRFVFYLSSITSSDHTGHHVTRLRATKKNCFFF